MTNRQHSLLSALLLAPAFAAFGLLVFQALPSNLVLLPPVPLGPPLREGDRVFLYTSQIQKRLTYKPFSAGRVTLTDLHIDLWVFDANSAEPLFRWRLSSERDGSPLGRSVLGIQDNSLWLRTPNGALLYSLSTDKFLPPPPKPPPPLPPAPSDSFRSRGLVINNHWLGLLADHEVPLLRDKRTFEDLESVSPRRLWSARQSGNSYADFRPLGGEYQAPALLSVNSKPLLVHDPDSVLILHYDRSGPGAYLRLSRIGGPDGRTLWDTTLPIATLQSVLPGQFSVVLFGVIPSNLPPQQLLVAVDLATGAVQPYNLDIVGIHPKATPAAGR